MSATRFKLMQYDNRCLCADTSIIKKKGRELFVSS